MPEPAGIAHPPLTVRAVRATAVRVPMRFVLGTSAAAVREAPLLLVDVETEEGVTGHAWQFCYVDAAAPGIVRMLVEVEGLAKGQRVAPEALWALLAKRFRLIGVEGIVRMALAMFDTACWDALAKAAKLPLARYLGAEPRPVPTYNSNGLGLMPAAQLADEAEQLLAGGFKAIKLRLGYPTLEEDVAALRAVRGRVSDGIAIPVDYNQALEPDEAIRRGRALQTEGAYWLEEPIRHDDYTGCARVANALALPVQIGENFSQVHDMEKALAAGACDLVMPDLERIGGVTGWRRAAALAQARGIQMSSHLYPEVSAHLLCATPTAHWLEYVDWANAVLQEPLVIADGMAVPSARPGNGLAWDAGAVARYRLI